MAVLKLSSPWTIFYRELDALFGKDPEVMVIFYEDELEVKLYVTDAAKAEAIAELLPSEKEFGVVTLKITVVPPNGCSIRNGKIDTLRAAFSGNPVLSYIRTISGVFSNNLTYVVFRNEVVQYFNDSIGDINGLCSTLYQTIAKDVLGDIDGVYYCTDTPGSMLPF